MLQNYFKQNSKIILIGGYLSIIIIVFLLALTSDLIQEDYEIKNQALPYFVRIYDYSAMISIYIVLHFILAISFFKKNKSLAYICSFIGLLLLLLIAYPIVFRI